MKKHILSAEDLEGFETETRIAANHGAGINKSIDVLIGIVNGEFVTFFKVKNNKETICRDTSLTAAIQAYNSF